MLCKPIPLDTKCHMYDTVVWLRVLLTRSPSQQSCTGNTWREYLIPSDGRLVPSLGRDTKWHWKGGCALRWSILYLRHPAEGIPLLRPVPRS